MTSPRSLQVNATFDLFPTGCYALGLAIGKTCPKYYDVLYVGNGYVYLGYSNLVFGVCSPQQRTTVLDDLDKYVLVPYPPGPPSSSSSSFYFSFKFLMILLVLVCFAV